MGGIAAYGRLGRHVGTPPDATPVRSADLLMQDHDDGSISVFDARSHALIDTVPPETNGFLRVVLAGLVRERRREEIGSPSIRSIDAVVRGRLTLDDAATTG